MKREKLTAYALGELAGKEESGAREFVAQNAEAREYVEEMREIAGMVSARFSKEHVEGLSEEHRERIRAELEGAGMPAEPRRIRWYLSYPMGAAAALLLAAGVTWVFQPRAMRDTTPDVRYPVALSMEEHGEKSRPRFSSVERDKAGDIVVADGLDMIRREKEMMKRESPWDAKEDEEAVPVIVTEEFEIGDHFDADDDQDLKSARGFEDAVSFADAGSTGIVSSIGVGAAGPPGGRYGWRGAGGRCNAQLPSDVAGEETPEPYGRELHVTLRERPPAATPSPAIKRLQKLDAVYGTRGEVPGWEESGKKKTEESKTLAELSPDSGFGYRPYDAYQRFAQEAYDKTAESPFFLSKRRSLSTFSIDVDTASYSNVRRFINEGSLPPKEAVRIEELVNYFPYDYPQPAKGVPFSVNVEIASCPWNLQHRLAKVGIKGREVRAETRPPANLVFLLDVSGSMSPQNKLPLVKKAMRKLIEKLNDADYISIVTYASNANLVLPATSCERRNIVIRAIDGLMSGGSTDGSEGIQLAYQMAAKHFIRKGTNRVILCTDGDFNVGITDDASLVKLIDEKAKTGVFLSVLGFGMGNLKDAKMEKLADKGNGNYAYIDDLAEAEKVLYDQMTATLVTIAKDVKVQVEFNPATVAAYRLIGYENRTLRKEDFNDDTKDAGEVGAGHTVTALYEIVPAGEGSPRPRVDRLRYQRGREEESEVYIEPPAGNVESFFVKLRYKEPDGEVSKRISFPVVDGGKRYSRASADFKFAASVASFGMILKNSPYRGDASLASVIELAGEGIGRDHTGHRREFIQLARRARQMKRGG